MLAAAGPGLETRLRELRDAAERAERRSHAPHARVGDPEKRAEPLVRRRALDASSVERESIRVFAQTLALVDRYPTDPGVLVTLLLNHVVLAAGEAMFIDAGVIHAYTSGFGVEIMAASDNVLRAGLTPKHVDIPELLQITNFTPTPPPRWEPTLLGEEDLLLVPPADEFELAVLRVRDAVKTLPGGGPAIAL